ncbi:hypothetical protein QQY24_01885 [Streptomyces sp. TG1A-8]|uniref:hypothetical protein n=1 Tax=Streptomyces sp. TG1A-8 TaxID=3051385 RepID=UPI00265BF36A|nr:hypothetical protein [Streptomyces sp. TG1A-8]MDO0924224.1 hypothetical protein [Streptomyces sp. TG1A-8]
MSDPDLSDAAAAGTVWVVGGPGCGKSTLAAALAEVSGAPAVQLDDLFWGPGGHPNPEEVFVASVRSALSGPRWIADGQYPAALAACVDRADCVIWLDVPLLVSWPRLVRRTVSRWIRGERLWGGTRETLRTVIGPRSILWYALRVRRTQQRANEELFARLQDSGVRLVRTRTYRVRSLVGHGRS